ncbi:MAG: sugar transferase [Gemmatales bacterium]|nr:sugar transferase [Gemmatales bacterium]MDW8176572.1 sugar transferase [Gemmatales bacterium]
MLESLEQLLALVIMVIVSPMLVVLMVLIRLTSPGPAIFKQVRVGKHGRLFTLYKLRTMYHNCELSSGPRWSCPGDPRVTPLGRFLRATHLDEIPQLINVLQGDMALVGPRPERPEFTTILCEYLPDYTKRLYVKPGITGLAQIQLPPDTDLYSVQKKLACDLYYVSQRSFGLDLRILLATALRIVGIPASITLRILGLPRWDTVTQKQPPASSGLCPSERISNKRANYPVSSVTYLHGKSCKDNS